MKKLSIFFMTMILAISCMIPSAFAYTSLDFGNVPDIPNEVGEGDYLYHYIFRYQDEGKDSYLLLLMNSENPAIIDSSNNFYVEASAVGYDIAFYRLIGWGTDNPVWMFPVFEEDYYDELIYPYSLVWSNTVVKSYDGSIYMNKGVDIPVASPKSEFCDGSSCPAVDANIDGICDDCGMTLMSLSRSPVAPDVTGSNKNYVMFYSGTVYQYTAYTSDSSYTIRGEEYGARYRTYLDPDATATRFQSYDGINWEQTYNGTTANDYPGEIGWELTSSTYDWYTEEGDRFFPVPLWEEVQTVTQGEMGILTSETAGTMRTLVVCGVGLMACLMALSLFGKRWLLFLR